MRLTRRTFLASSMLSACGGTAALETLHLTAPEQNPQTPQTPIDPRCCASSDFCSVVNDPAPVPTIGDTLGLRWFLALGGQSNAVGRAPAVTLNQPFRNERASADALLPLVEIDRETIRSSAANMLTHLSGGLALQVLAHSNAASGTEYAGLKKGSAAYTRMMRQLSTSKDSVARESGELRALAFMIIHGESDHVLKNSHYAQDLMEWQADNQIDMRAVTGQIEPVPMFLDQMASFTTYGDATSTIPIAQLRASIENQNKIFCVAPKYQFAYEDGKHLLSSNLQWLGEHYGKVMKRVFLDGESWRPLSPREVHVGEAKNSIRAKFWVPNPPLVFDTTRVPAKANMGFELGHSDVGVGLPPIDKVTMVSEDTIEIVARGMLPACTRLRYAFTGTPGAKAGVRGPGTEGSARGNLRDSDTTRSFASSWELFNWCTIFDVPIAGT